MTTLFKQLVLLIILIGATSYLFMSVKPLISSNDNLAGLFIFSFLIVLTSILGVIAAILEGLNDN